MIGLIPLHIMITCYKGTENDMFSAFFKDNVRYPV